MGSTRAEKLDSLRRLADEQHGVITRAQAIESGFSRSAISRAAARADWEPLYPGIYLIDRGAEPLKAAVAAGVLRAPRRTWASHRTAAYLWGIDSVAPLRPELTTLANLRGGQAVIYRVATLPDEDRRRLDGIPLTSPERTLVDLGSRVSEARLESAVLAALRQRLTNVSRLRDRAEALVEHGRPGPTRLLGLLRAWDRLARPESVLETKLLRLIHSEGLPKAVTQWPVRERGRVVARLDFAYPDQLVALEADGYRWHGDVARWQAHLARRNALTRLGWLVLHFTWNDVEKRPERVVETIRSALAARHRSARRAVENGGPT